jgi:DNA-binding HxlR family transcriptional regulator
MMDEDSAKYSQFAAHAVELLQGKWKMQIFYVIRSGLVRRGQLARLIPSASKKVLTENLRELEASGIVVRRDLCGTVRHVEYDFTDAMRADVCTLLDSLVDWGEMFEAKGNEKEKTLS